MRRPALKRRSVWLRWAWALCVTCIAHSVAAGTRSTPEGIRFTYASPTASSVFLAGAFNDWNATANPMQRDGEVFSTLVRLPPGEHEYKFVVDDNWVADPDNPTTIGAYGNSVIRVGQNGELLEMEATSNTSLSPKILLHGRYIGLFIGRRDAANADRFAVRRPDFNVDFDFGVRISDAASARVLTKVRNAAEETPLWETSLRFDRGHLDVHRPNFEIRVFDNDGIGTWDDPLHLVGDIGRYDHAFGFKQQGARVRVRQAGVEAEFFYADNFESGNLAFPAVSLPEGSFRYVFNLQDTNKNVLAARLTCEVMPGVRLGGSFRNDRGFNPGAFSRVHTEGDTLRIVDHFGTTNESWAGGGLDLLIDRRDRRWSAFGEFLYGEAWVRTGVGTRTRQLVASQATLSVAPLDGESIGLDVSRRWTLGGEYRPFEDVGVAASLEQERHLLAAAATDSGETFDNRALVYRTGVDFDLKPRFAAPVRLGLELEIFDFEYPATAPWHTQLWFADRNFWMEHGEHRLPVGRYTQLGGQDATTWRPWLTATLWPARGVTFRYDGAFRAQEVDQEIELWESRFRFEVPIRPSLRFTSQTRWARYAEPDLGIHGGWVSTFAEFEYRFTPTIAVALSYGVDPYVLDVVTNEYDEIGINEFLEEQGLDPSLARDRYNALSTRLPQAEQALADERRLQLEAIVTF